MSARQTYYRKMQIPQQASVLFHRHFCNLSLKYERYEHRSVSEHRISRLSQPRYPWLSLTMDQIHRHAFSFLFRSSTCLSLQLDSMKSPAEYPVLLTGMNEETQVTLVRDGPDHCPIFDEADDFHGPLPFWTHQGINFVCLFNQSCPTFYKNLVSGL